jgi:hypothetical protein
MSSNEADFAELSLANALTNETGWDFVHEIWCFVTVIA